MARPLWLETTQLMCVHVNTTHVSRMGFWGVGTLSCPWGWVRWSVPLPPVLEGASAQIGPALLSRSEIQEAEAELDWA